MSGSAAHLHEVWLVLAALSLAIWLYLLLFRGFFWVARLPVPVAPPARWPSVVAVVPARNEAAVVGEAVSSPLAAGWTGKLWALSEGVRQVEERCDPPELLLFTDADIGHHRSNLAELVARLEGERRDLVSLMVRLRCESWAERLMIPAFVFFFAMLYPFAWSNDPRRTTAAAAGGCVLLRRSAFARSGGFAAIRGALIDDCALAKAVKASGGSTWLGLTRETKSLRPYPRLGDIWRMVARTAYTQLRYSPLLLAGTVLGLGITYLVPPALT